MNFPLGSHRPRQFLPFPGRMASLLQLHVPADAVLEDQQRVEDVTLSVVIDVTGLLVDFDLPAHGKLQDRQGVEDVNIAVTGGVAGEDGR